ncbi:hypothetical protein BDV98DRAFT_576436 [Pterulicium gracile]|uniref:Uncharacterized protein n=1 Tax=Pterulicium gracile TaxID=1884261 RepID=A0A5C3Q3X8_9AGAR|nr:hypothetical protein BDV98DRAFT_576436 [Pterula gracilis]
MQALLDARLKIHEEFNPEEYRTDGKMSVSASGTAIKTQGGNILSENYGAVRYVIPKAYFSSQGPVGSMNDFEGDDAVFNGPRSRLDAPDGILSGNRGVMGRSNFAGAEISTGSGIGSIFCGNSNVRTENGNVLDPVALNMLIAQGYVAASQASSIHHPAAHLPNLPPFVGVNASSQYAQPVLGPNLKNGVRGLYNNNTPGPRSGFSGKYGNGGSNALHYSPQQSSFDPSERGDAPMS